MGGWSHHLQSLKHLILPTGLYIVHSNFLSFWYTYIYTLCIYIRFLPWFTHLPHVCHIFFVKKNNNNFITRSRSSFSNLFFIHINSYSLFLFILNSSFTQVTRAITFNLYLTSIGESANIRGLPADHGWTLALASLSYLTYVQINFHDTYIEVDENCLIFCCGRCCWCKYDELCGGAAGGRWIIPIKTRALLFFVFVAGHIHNLSFQKIRDQCTVLNI